VENEIHGRHASLHPQSPALVSQTRLHLLWLQRWEYLRFVLREISSVFVAIFVVETLFQIYALSRGPEAYATFVNFLKSPSSSR